MKSTSVHFEAILYRPENPADDGLWSFLLIPKDVSEVFPRRGRTTVDGVINGQSFQVTLEPDGQLSHWLKVSEELRERVGANIGDVLKVELSPVGEEPDPEVPADFAKVLLANADAQRTWESTTSLARLDWIHWIVSGRQAKTREKRVQVASEMLADGKKRVCCFDPSGYYSKAFQAPKPSSTSVSRT